MKSSNICFIDFHQNELLRLQNPSGSPLLGPLDHGVSLGGLKTDQIAMVRSQQLLCYKFPLIVSDHGSRRTWGPSPSGSGFWVRKGAPHSLNQGHPAILFFLSFCQNAQLRLLRLPVPPLRTPYPGWGYWVETPQEPSCPQGPPTCQISSRSVQQFGFL